MNAAKLGWLAAALALLPVASGQSQGTISGTVARAGQDLSGTVVIACLMTGGACDPRQSKTGPLGVTDSFVLLGLGAGPYLILALRDLNGSGDLDVGDEAAIYSRDGKTPTLLRPPQQNIFLRLRRYDGTDASLLAPPAPRQSQATSALLGTWSSANEVTGILYTFKPDGSYLYTARVNYKLRSGCNRNGVYTPAYSLLEIGGSYRASGDHITLTPRRGTYTSDIACEKTERPTSPDNLKPRTFTWYVGEHAGSAALFLSDANGEQIYYR